VQGGAIGLLKRAGLGLAAGFTFVRLYCLPTVPNALPINMRVVPSW
jgi:magnesium-protoporphyrin IX monomethyl ester (oxidative) cyclase